MTYRDHKDAQIASLTAKLEAAEAQIAKLNNYSNRSKEPGRVRVLMQRFWLWLTVWPWRDRYRRQKALRHATRFFVMAIIGAISVLAVYGLYRGVKAIAEMQPPLSAGYVIGRRYVPASTTTTTDSKGHTHMQFHPAQWWLTIGFDNDTHSYMVSHGTYDATLQGDWACTNDNAPCTEPPADRRR